MSEEKENGKPKNLGLKFQITKTGDDSFVIDEHTQATVGRAFLVDLQEKLAKAIQQKKDELAEFEGRLAQVKEQLK